MIRPVGGGGGSGGGQKSAVEGFWVTASGNKQQLRRRQFDRSDMYDVFNTKTGRVWARASVHNDQMTLYQKNQQFSAKVKGSQLIWDDGDIWTRIEEEQRHRIISSRPTVPSALEGQAAGQQFEEVRGDEEARALLEQRR